MNHAVDPTFEREAYLNLADEFDPMGSPYGPDKPMQFYADEWDAEAVKAARAFASRYALPLPWDIRSVDEALRLVVAAERRERDAR